MNIYLDSSDLIRLISRNEPMPPNDFAELLTARDWQLVYSFVNICEVVVVNELLETRRRLQVLEQLPHTYIIAIPVLRCVEFASAVEAFKNSHEPALIDPYVRRWHQTYTYPGQADHQNMLVNYTLTDQVLPIAAKNPNVCRNLPRHAALVQHAVDEDREVTDAVRRNRERFIGGVGRALLDCQIRPPEAGLARFARWVRAEPSRCPGWRIFTESYLEFCTNVQDQVAVGDLSDFSHIACLPYVDAITLDRRMAGYAREAALKLDRRNVQAQLSNRIFSNAEMWLQSI